MVVAMPLISRMVSLMPPIAVTQSPVEDWMAVTCPAISSVAFAVWLARALTSEATTAKPLPASPARAASMVALSASRLVWLAIAPIRRSTSPIFSPAAARPADHFGGFPGLGHGGVRDVAGMGDLAADLGHRRSELFGGGGNRVDAGGGLLGGGCGGRGLRRRAVDAGGDLRRHALHVLGRPRHRADHALDVGFETVGHLALQRLLLQLGLLLGGFLRLAHGARLDHVAAEHVDRPRHGAEFVLAVASRGSSRRYRHSKGGS